ncbi:homoprotocatechuate degradation operon regulator HpaR [Janthinobacterium sp. 17J80-10]|uniref:homoprotocatechuate degradation operon regulator HpaR n=1 Tax=Janthinobacterium sp. 17J80-10 TaxID=2497863 RepID=UPI0010056FAD|nr:homoprotocatechuate degradation operon regulator HpaR [Janthinobacterium sp. 17J80-10]QAU34755.1 homoprotocatechuate degradation operon regulator HpaR [Janthinobacterium sp. 17J80-10]
MQPRITYRNLPQLLLKGRDRLMSNFRPILNRFGVTEQQWRILRALDEYEQLEPREICEMCQILSPSMAGVLARMEDLGLVSRNRLPEDQRRVMVRLAHKGDQLITEIAPLIDARYHELEQAFGKKVFDDLFQALENFIEAQTRTVTIEEAQQTAVQEKARRKTKPGGR